jgi:hypothetical protein
MAKQVFSLIVKCLRDPQTDVIQLLVIRTDTAEEVQLDGSSFLLRITTLEGGQAERCFIRHIASGREIYVQSGPGLRAFVTSCLLADAQ